MDMLDANEKKILVRLNEMSLDKNVIKGGALIVINLEDLGERFIVLQGEIRAGNDSKIVKNELSEILNKLVENKLVSVKDAIKLSKELILDI